MNNDYAQQPNLDQEAFDKRMQAMPDKERKAMVKGLAALARSKVKPDSNSSETDTSAPSLPKKG